MNAIEIRFGDDQLEQVIDRANERIQEEAARDELRTALADRWDRDGPNSRPGDEAAMATLAKRADDASDQDELLEAYVRYLIAADLAEAGGATNLGDVAEEQSRRERLENRLEDREGWSTPDEL